MNLSYKRHLNSSYMIIKEEEKPCQPYEIKILQSNKINGLLPMQIIQMGHNLEYWYDITGKQSLSLYLEREQIRADFLLQIVSGLKNVCTEISNYFLEENRIYLLHEYIYFNFKMDRFYFTYVPFVQQELGVEFKTFMELVLQKIDHSDKTSVEIGYELYQMAQNKQLDTKQLFQKINFQIDKQKNNEEVTALEEDIKKEKTEEVTVKTIEKERKNSWNFKIFEYFKVKLKKLITKNPSYTPVIMVNSNEDNFKNMYPTEYLGQSEDMIIGTLVYKGNKNNKDIIINKDLFIIGKDEERVDTVIYEPSISRIHAKIEIINKNYYLEDLNSTNGTFINGELLDYRKKIKIETNDKISFGREDYLFQ